MAQWSLSHHRLSICVYSCQPSSKRLCLASFRRSWTWVVHGRKPHSSCWNVDFWSYWGSSKCDLALTRWYWYSWGICSCVLLPYAPGDCLIQVGSKGRCMPRWFGSTGVDGWRRCWAFHVGIGWWSPLGRCRGSSGSRQDHFARLG